MQELFAKVGSPCPQRENFRLTGEVKAKFTEKLRQTPREFFGRKVKGVVRSDRLKLICENGAWVCYRLSRARSRWCELIRKLRVSSICSRQAMDVRIKNFPKIRVVSSSEEGFRRLIEWARRAEAWAGAMIEKLRPICTTLYGIRRHLATGAVVVVTAWLFVHVMFGLNGMVVYRQKRAEFQSLQEQIKDLKQENVRYTEQIHSLRTDPKAIEKEAREQLHYARPGEVIYVSPSPVLPPVPDRRTAKK